MNSPRLKKKGKLELPIYPRAFIAEARLAKERDRVFVAMPFEADHSETLWRIIKAVCDIRGLNVRRVDDLPHPTPIVADILDEIERAQIVIADLTGMNPNVLYELGIAHVRCDSVVLLCRKGQSLPFDLTAIRCIFYKLDTEEGKVQLSEYLGRTLDALRGIDPPTVIDSVLKRTRLIVDDLEMVASLPDEELSSEVVWISGFLSAFAISEEEFEPGESEYKDLLMQEKESLIQLARRGCLVRCVITPPSQQSLIPAKLDYARQRLATLIKFLKSGDPALKNIEWVVSPFRQKSFYIIGHISTFEGYKKGVQRGFSLSLRQTGHNAISTNIAIYEVLFKRFSTYTLTSYRGSGKDDLREALREATLKCLKESVEYLNNFMTASAGPN